MSVRTQEAADTGYGTVEAAAEQPRRRVRRCFGERDLCASVECQCSGGCGVHKRPEPVGEVAAAVDAVE